MQQLKETYTRMVVEYWPGRWDGPSRRLSWPEPKPKPEPSNPWPLDPKPKPMPPKPWPWDPKSEPKPEPSNPWDPKPKPMPPKPWTGGISPPRPVPSINSLEHLLTTTDLHHEHQKNRPELYRDTENSLQIHRDRILSDFNKKTP